MPLEGHRPPPWTATMVPAVRSTSSARWSENARRGLPGSTMTISPRKIAWLRYDINTNSLLLAERLVPNFLRAARATFPKLQCSAGAHELGDAREPLDEER